MNSKIAQQYGTMGGSLDELNNEYDFLTMFWDNDGTIEAPATHMLVGANCNVAEGGWQLLFVKFGLSEASEVYIQDFIQAQAFDQQQENNVDAIDLSSFQQEDD
jgi:hypothetical protein